MKKKTIVFLCLVFPFILNAFCFSSHYEGKFNEYRKNRISSKIHYLSGKYYPKVAEAIFNNVDAYLDNAVISIIWKESRFKAHVTSDRYWGHYRDYGLMQVSMNPHSGAAIHLTAMEMSAWIMTQPSISMQMYQLRKGCTI